MTAANFKMIKRDGRTEDFDPNKANGWAEYGSETYRNRCDWGSAITEASRSFSGRVLVHTDEWHLAVIRALIGQNKWPAQVAAGRMYIRHLEKEMYGGKHPTVLEMHRKLQGLGLMRDLDYSEADYAQVEEMIDHEEDLKMAHFQIEQLRFKYAIKNRAAREEIYETPQYILMRMAMALSEDDPAEDRMRHVGNFYRLFKSFFVSSPSPNYEYLGTKHHGLLSCCLFGGNDNAKSLAAMFHIAHELTLQSAGLGAMINVRGPGDPIKNGLRKHNGLYNYQIGLGAMTRANVQGERNGSVTSYYSAYNPEAEMMTMSQNHKTDESASLRRFMHVAMVGNDFLAKQALEDGLIPIFTSWDNQQLWDAMFSKDRAEFGRVATEFMASGKAKTRSALDLVHMKNVQTSETSTVYYFNATAANVHTAFLEPIRHANLCNEITQPNTPYTDIKYLYIPEDHGQGEISMCAIGSINVDLIDDDDLLYEEAAYYALRMIYKCIQMTDYAFPHLAFTAKARRNAAVGMLGVGNYLSRRGLSWSDEDGLAAIHRLAERHWYYVALASCRLAEEFGPAPWIHKTKYPQGYSVLDTYYREVDEILPAEKRQLRYDHAGLKEYMIRVGGGAFSTLVSHFPNESSSKVLPGTLNSIYEARSPFLVKEDKGKILYWCARDNDIMEYKSAWNLSGMDQIKGYAIFQKFADGGISLDRWNNRSKGGAMSGDDLVVDFAAGHYYGLKGHYYTSFLAPAEENSSAVNARLAAEAAIKKPVANERISCAGGCD